MARLDVVIPGAQKAGTTTLVNVLGTHPQVARHATTEFAALMDPAADLTAAVDAAYPDAGTRTTLAKSAGVMHLPGGLERLHAENPRTRLLFMLREPVARMYSAYWFARRTGDEPLEDFEEAVAREGQRLDVPAQRRSRTDYRGRSDYLTPLRTARDLFGPDRVHAVLLEDFGAHRIETLATVQEWLGLEVLDLTDAPAVSNAAAGVRSRRLARVTHTGPAARLARAVLPPAARQRVRLTVRRFNEKDVVIPPLDPEMRRTLQATFAAQRQALELEFGIDLARWGPTAT